MVRLVVEDGLRPEQDGYFTQQALLGVFSEALNLALKKDIHYSGAWRRQGWMGNLARVMSKVARLRSMCWKDWPIESSEETSQDTALDLINLSAFFLLNKRSDNRWGE